MESSYIIYEVCNLSKDGQKPRLCQNDCTQKAVTLNRVTAFTDAKYTSKFNFDLHYEQH